MTRTTLTTDPSIEGSAPIDWMRIRRCRGCAKCMYENPGRCILEDDLSLLIPTILSSEEMVLHATIDDHWFSMPMRKAVERIGNILEAWTDSGHNDPRDPDEISLRKITVIVCGPIDDVFESSTRKVLQKGPVEVVFDYE